MDIAGCHPDDLRYYPISSGWHVIWTLSHPDGIAPDRISSGWLMANALCHPDDLAGVGISFGWITANLLCQPDDIPFHLMSSRWLNWGCYLIQMSYGNIIMSSGWYMLPFLSHLDELENFNLSQHAVALQPFHTYYPYIFSQYFDSTSLYGYKFWYWYRFSLFSLEICHLVYFIANYWYFQFNFFRFNLLHGYKLWALLNINFIRHFNLVTWNILSHFKVDPEFFLTAPGWSNYHCFHWKYVV